MSQTIFERPKPFWVAIFNLDPNVSLTLRPMMDGSLICEFQSANSPQTDIILRLRPQKANDAPDVLLGEDWTLLRHLAEERIVGSAAAEIMDRIWLRNFISAPVGHWARDEFDKWFPKTAAWYTQCLERLPNLLKGPPQPWRSDA